MITTQEIKVMREESDWVGEQLQRLEHAVFYLNRSRERELPAEPQRSA